MPRRLPLHNLAPSGATVGQVPVWDGDEWAPDDGGSGGSLVPLVGTIDGVPDLIWTDDDDPELVLVEVP